MLKLSSVCLERSGSATWEMVILMMSGALAMEIKVDHQGKYLESSELGINHEKIDLPATLFR